MDQPQALLTTALSLVNLTDHFQSIVTVLSLVNPAICGVMFAQFGATRVGSGDPRSKPVVGWVERSVSRAKPILQQYRTEVFGQALPSSPVH